MDQITPPAAAVPEEKLNLLRERYDGVLFEYQNPEGEKLEGGFDDLMQQCPHFRVLGAGAIRGTLDGMIEDGAYREAPPAETIEAKKK